MVGGGPTTMAIASLSPQKPKGSTPTALGGLTAQHSPRGHPAARASTSSAMAKRSNRVLLLIGVMKLVKAALLMGAGLVALKLVRGDPGEIIERWAAHLRFD